MTQETRKRQKPDWLKIKVPKGKEYIGVKDIVERKQLHTICSSGKCPNKEDCWGRGTATFMILGNICTRSCKFCAVETGRPHGIDWQEPERVAESVQKMNLKHCVITSVDRDDLRTAVPLSGPLPSGLSKGSARPLPSRPWSLISAAAGNCCSLS